MKETFYTCTKAEIISKSLNKVLSEISSSSANTVCVIVNNDKLGFQNAVNLIEHKSLEDAKEYSEAKSNAEYDRTQILKEQGV